ncbi:unnamed protein product [Rhizoctonia solani]|uniref:L-tryptophan decarboxylase PsiD-like domain-containing protein n=1 Tax=Rhizoctonia solani TaxID=456999 RepID=A0A8H3H679_9AGAM|nr:unnamed protein product [Rhizoctonia solani]
MFKPPYQPNVPQAPTGPLGSAYGGLKDLKGQIDDGSGPKPLTVGQRVGGWLPKDHPIVEQYISKLLQKVEQDKRSIHELSPSVVQFKEFIDTTPALLKGFGEMFEQVPIKLPLNSGSTLKPKIRDYDTMFKAFDYIITHAIPYEDKDLVGFPINGILDLPMGTDAGLYNLLIPELNVHFKNMFDEWSKFLSSPESRTYLTTDANGWFGPAASTDMPNFAETYVCDPTAEYYGFKSWDDFFTREFRDGVRPIEFPDDDRIINSACESSVYRVAYDVKERDSFWLKGESYSLGDIFDYDTITNEFVGGTVYQAFLSAHQYHRWASPVNGVIKKVTIIPGSYYAESPTIRFGDPDGLDPSVSNWSQGLITSAATRAIIYIQSDNPDIGLMAFVGIGLSDVSSCDVTVKEGLKVAKGGQLGMFHFGGSTHCLLFRRGVKITFDEKYTTPEAEVLLNAPIATVG